MPRSGIKKADANVEEAEEHRRQAGVACPPQPEYCV